MTNKENDFEARTGGLRGIRMLRLLLRFCLLLCGSTAISLHGQQPELFFYMQKETVRQGCFYKPSGKGPFPVMIYNQATPKPAIDLGNPTPFLTLAKFYVSNGYILFLPGRPLLNEPVASSSTEKKEGSPMSEDQLLRIFEAHNENIACAVEWLKAQAIVDVDRLYMSGHSTGAIQAILLCERELGIRGYIAFSPAVKLWDANPRLQAALSNAVKKQKAPLFLIQPQNDLGFGPSIALGPEIALKPKPNRAKIFSPYGKNQVEGNTLAFNAPEIWGADVLQFMTLCKPVAKQ